MGNCCLKNEPNYIMEESRKSVEKTLANSMDTAATVNDSSCNLGLSASRKMSTLQINPGEEELFSKKINIDSFEIEKVIGKGGYGKVLLVKKIDTGKFYAMKEIKKESIASDRDKLNTIFERVILQNVNSPFIVNLHYAFQTSEKLYYVLDFCSGGELFFHLKKSFKFSEKKARFYAAECTLALQELHKNKIIYRDLKPENILLDSEGHVMLTDFGLSKIMHEKENMKCYTFAGTPEYLSPEIISAKGYSKEVDWWSLGAILYEMLVGVQPFHHNNHQKLLDNILYQDLRFPETVSKDAKDLLKKLLERNPEKRLGYGPNGADDVKNHKFFKCIDWKQLERKEIKPPFKPTTKFESDSRNFDKEFTDLRIDGTEAACKLSIKEKQENYIRDFTYYTGSADIKNGNIDIAKVLEANMKAAEVTDKSKFDSILEANEDEEDNN